MPVDYPLLKSEWQFIKDASSDEFYSGLYEAATRLNEYFNRVVDNDSKISFFQNIFKDVTLQNSAAKFLLNPDEYLLVEPDFKATKFLNKWKHNDESAIREGRQLFDAFSNVFRTTICSKQGVLGTLYKGMVNTDELPILIATHILNNHLSEKKYWYVFALLISCSINKEGIEIFCKER